VPELILLANDTPVLRCPLHGQALSFGRSPANDVSLPDDDAPPMLASFEPRSDGAYAVVARAAKALVVNGERTESHVLRDGDVVNLGRLVARFSTAAPSAPEAPRMVQRTGLLRTSSDGKITRTELQLEVPGRGVWEIPPSGIRIGALSDNDIVIDDGFVSSFHAQVFARGERLFVRDLDSTNGTFVKGVRVIEAELMPDVDLRVGKTVISVVTRESEERIGSPAGKGPWTCGEMVTSDPPFAKTFALIEKVAAHDATVCVFGETGTGKELVAAAVHKLSGRRRGPFVPLNCAAIPATLIESVLFGHEKGAFTGADRQQKGVFEDAHEGTIFLDEIGELPLELQSKLLRVLETRQVRRLGGRTDISVDVRVVAATHRDLVRHVAEGKFREDLLHRLYIIPIALPPLRERGADAIFLAEHFASKLSPAGKAPKLTTAAKSKIMEHRFPGNVRELRNVVQRALIMMTGAVIDDDSVQFLPTHLEDVKENARIYRKGMKLDDVERQLYREAIAAYGSIAAAAKALQVSKSTLWRRATALGLVSSKNPDDDGELT
jgi:DNA-binding NtrC family response regulator/pSer/pThr/pTyr-binding forkhead associated (FHA) protein